MKRIVRARGARLPRGRRKREEAISEYRLAIQLDPKLTVAHNGLGNELADQGKHEEASSAPAQGEIDRIGPALEAMLRSTP